jgi:hypothetical protein
MDDEYRRRRDNIITHAWETWTLKGLNLDIFKQRSTKKSAGHEADDRYLDGISDEDWLAATLAGLLVQEVWEAKERNLIAEDFFNFFSEYNPEVVRRAYRIYDEQRELDTLDDWGVWRNGNLFARCETLRVARALIRNTRGEDDTWEIIDDEGGNPGLTYDDSYDALVSEALAEDARVGNRFDADGFYDFFPDHDDEAVFLAWSIYDQMRRRRGAGPQHARQTRDA